MQTIDRLKAVLATDMDAIGVGDRLIYQSSMSVATPVVIIQVANELTDDVLFARYARDGSDNQADNDDHSMDLIKIWKSDIQAEYYYYPA